MNLEILLEKLSKLSRQCTVAALQMPTATFTAYYAKASQD